MDSAREDVPAPSQYGEHGGIDPAFLCQVKTEVPEDRELGADRDEYGAVYHVVREGADSAFRALALRLFRDEQHHPTVRGAVVNHVVNNWLATYAQLTGFVDQDAYRWHVGQDGTPVGAAEVRAAGEAFYRTVAVVQDGVLELASLSSTDHDPIVLRRTGAPPAEHYDVCITLPPAGWKGGPAELSGLGWPTRATTEGLAGVVEPFQEEFQAEVKMQGGMEMEDVKSLADPLADTAGHCTGSEAPLQGHEAWEVWIKEEVHDTSEQTEFPQEWELATEGGETAGARHQPASLEGGSYDGDYDSQNGLVETENLWIKNEEAELSDTTPEEQEWLSERRDEASSDSGSSPPPTPPPARDGRPRRVKHVPVLMRRGRGKKSVEHLEERAAKEREHMRRVRQDQRRRRQETETPEEREDRLKKEREAKRRLRHGAETPWQREARLAREREAKRRLRHGGETPGQREARLAKEREEQSGLGEGREYREMETPEQREARLKKWREDKRRQRESETPEQREARLSKEREAKRRLRYGGETPEEREARLSREREARWPRREEETLEQYEARLREDLEYMEELFVKGETAEQREERLRKMREEKRRQRENETPEQHEARLERRREERRQRIAKETPEERLERIKKERAWKGVPRKPTVRNETPEQREDRLKRFREYQKRRLHAETAEQRAARLSRMRTYARTRLLREKGASLEPTAATAEDPFAAEAFLGGAQQQEQAPLGSGEQPVGISSALPGGGEQ